ncbi:MAG: DUF3119 family protein [Phormidesmis sp.]
MTTTSTGSTTLTPSYKLPISITLLSLPLLFIQLGFGLFLALLGLFLLYQTSSIRLRFAEVALEVWRGEPDMPDSGARILRTFPYAEWENWEIFWPAVPILFYFKEINSIHFLPILFSPSELRSSLQTHISASL